MKPRPRSVEREVAARLSEHFALMGWSPVERIPILGREGPDIDINESKLAIDVKSRKCVPVTNYFLKPETIFCSLDSLLYVRLEDFPLLYSDCGVVAPLLFPSVQVNRWFAHMKMWADINHAIPAIIAHIPGTHIDNAVVVIDIRDRRRMKETYKLWQEEHLTS